MEMAERMETHGDWTGITTMVFPITENGVGILKAVMDPGLLETISMLAGLILLLSNTAIPMAIITFWKNGSAAITRTDGLHDPNTTTFHMPPNFNQWRGIATTI